jgi:hypothetical protein
MHLPMKKNVVTILFMLIALMASANRKSAIQNFDKAAFYSVLKAGKTVDIDEQLALLKTSSVSEKDAYEGALLMRKAGLVKLPVERLKLFKKGRIELETAIADKNTNGEYRFLRLIIEEHAPKIVKYSKDIQADKVLIIKSYKSLPSAVQHAITDYSNTSAVIHPQDFQ